MAASLVVRHRSGASFGNIAEVAFDKTAKRRLSRPGECSFRIPSHLAGEMQADGFPLIAAGVRQIELSLDSTGLFHHGIVWNVEDEGEEDICYSRVTSYDPMVVWRYRPARDGPGGLFPDGTTGDYGDFSDPDFIPRNITGPQMIQEILEQSEQLAAYGADDAEGQLFLDLAGSTYATGGADLRGAPTNYPMSIADTATLLTNTGEVDIVIEPILGGVGPEGFQNIGRVHVYNGDYGTDRQGSVHLDYMTGDKNVRLFRRSEDMTTICNKLWYFLGQRIDQQHWRSNVTGDHPLLDSISSWPELSAERELSRALYGVYMLISIYDNFGSEASAYPLYVRQWMVETLLRLKPRELLYVTPVRTETNFTPPTGMDIYYPGDFDIGDVITLNTGQGSRKEQTGVQRIYSYTVTIDDDAVESLGELETSPDQDSI